MFWMGEIFKLLDINGLFLFEYEGMIFFLTERSLLLMICLLCFYKRLINFTIESVNFEFFLFDKIIGVLFSIELL